MAAHAPPAVDRRDTATTILATYAAGLEVTDLPDAVVAQARVVLADQLGVLLTANRRHTVGVALRSLPVRDGPCSVFGLGTGMDPIAAAFINGIGGHDIELDDFHAASRSHPAAVIVPAVLAVAEATPDITLGDVLTAIIVGYDVQVRVTRATGVAAMFDRGFHPSAVVGSIGAAAAAGRILRISPDRMAHALALAASQSSGLLTVSDDHSHMAKSFQTGIAARNGVTAASFAAEGFAASDDVLTGRHDSLRPFGGDASDPRALLTGLGTHFEILDTTLKRHACCALIHPAIDALSTIWPNQRPPADEVERIEVALAVDAAPRVDANRLWTHNTQYQMALATVEGRVGLEHHGERWTGDPTIRRLADRVTLRGDEALQIGFPERQAATVTVEVGGQRLTAVCEAPRGSPANPMTAAEVQDKFQRLAGDALGPDGASAAWSILQDAPVDSRSRSVIASATQGATAGA